MKDILSIGYTHIMSRKTWTVETGSSFQNELQLVHALRSVAIAIVLAFSLTPTILLLPSLFTQFILTLSL